MLFLPIAQVFDRLESTSSRLEMTDILADFFRGLEAGDLRSVVYLTQGKLHPDFMPQKLGMADRMILKAVAFTSGNDDEEVERMYFKEGDLGTVAEGFLAKKKQTSLFSSPLTLDRVIGNLAKIEVAEGKSSQKMKMKLLADILHDSDPLSARYICRIVSGRMRLGAASMTILDSLAVALATKDDRPDIERGFNISSDMGLVAYTLAEGGMDAVRSMHVRPGNPLRVMLAERLPTLDGILEKMGGSCAMEYKYDGVRMQAHIGGGDIKLFSRRLEDISSHFPDVVRSLQDSFRGKEAIVEGECVPVDVTKGILLPFQEVSHRRRKHGLDDAVKDYPVTAFLFDCIYLDGTDMTTLPYLERRSALSRAFELMDGLQLSEMKVVGNSEEAVDFFQKALESGCEGIMAKSLDDASGYRAGARGFHWIKFKKDYQSDLTDTMDLVVIGGFHGRGKRKGHYGALLMAVYDPMSSRYQSICKLGSGFDDAFLIEAPELLNPYLHPHKPNDVDSNMEPDVWFQPAVVLEVLAAEISISPTHTAASEHLQGETGLALRFPRFTGKVRDDKGPEQASTSDELWSMYQMQKPPVG